MMKKVLQQLTFYYVFLLITERFYLRYIYKPVHVLFKQRVREFVATAWN